MYQNQHARFTAVDPLLASGKNSNPQTFNRYVYVMNSPLQYNDPSGLQTAQPFCKRCKPTFDRKTGGLVVFLGDQVVPEGYDRITKNIERYKGDSGRVYTITPHSVLPYNTKTRAKEIMDEKLKIKGFSSEKQKMIEERVGCTLEPACKQAFKDAHRPTTEDVLLQRGITIASSNLLDKKDSVKLIGDGFNENARLGAKDALDDDDAFGFTSRPDPYNLHPFQRPFIFFTDDAFKLSGYFELYGPMNLNEGVPHELTHGSGVRGYRKPSWFQGGGHDLHNYTYYDEILNDCMCPEGDN